MINTDYLKNLNKAQKEAVLHLDGPLLIVAGSGSGKTKLDMLEDNEIIRFLELDVPVYCINMIGDSWAVDEKKDIEIVEKRLKNE